VVSDRAVVDATLTYRDTRFMLGFQDPGLADVQGAYDRYTLVTSRSTTESEYRRPAWDVAITGATRRERVHGGGHDIEAGVEANGSVERRLERTGGGAVAVFDSRSGSVAPYQARIVRDGVTALGQRSVRAYVSIGRTTTRAPRRSRPARSSRTCCRRSVSPAPTRVSSTTTCHRGWTSAGTSAATGEP
jgi:hypothetical protein